MYEAQYLCVEAIESHAILQIWKEMKTSSFDLQSFYEYFYFSRGSVITVSNLLL